MKVKGKAWLAGEECSTFRKAAGLFTISSSNLPFEPGINFLQRTSALKRGWFLHWCCWGKGKLSGNEAAWGGTHNAFHSLPVPCQWTLTKPWLIYQVLPVGFVTKYFLLLALTENCIWNPNHPRAVEGSDSPYFILIYFWIRASSQFTAAVWTEILSAAPLPGAPHTQTHLWRRWLPKIRAWHNVES